MGSMLPYIAAPWILWVMAIVVFPFAIIIHYYIVHGSFFSSTIYFFPADRLINPKLSLSEFKLNLTCLYFF